MSIEAMKLALEALEYIEHNYMSLPAPAEKAITALREALTSVPDWASEAKEQPAPVAKPHEQEPVAWLVECGGDSALVRHTENFPGIFAGNEFNKRPLVFGDKSPPAQRKPLTDEEIIKCWGQVSGTRYGYVAFARAIEAAHGIKEKNNV